MCIKEDITYLDLNGDGVIDAKDLKVMIEHYGSFKGYPNYLRCLDFNNDGVIDMREVALIAYNFGEKVTDC